MAISAVATKQLFAEFTPANLNTPERERGLNTFGIILADVTVTIGVTADYGANGLILDAVAIWECGVQPACIGLRAFLAYDITTSGGTRRDFVPKYDKTNGTLRLFKMAAGALAEITGADLADGDLVYGMAFLVAPQQ